MNRLKVWVKGMKLLRAFYGILLALLGAYLTNNLDFFILFKVLAVFFAWEYTVVLNNIYDLEIDKLAKNENPFLLKLIEKEEYLKLGITMGLIAIVFSFFPSMMVTLLILLALFLGTIYSVPPLRLRRYPLTSCFIAIGSVISLMIGMLPCELYNYAILFLVIFFSVSIGTLIRDLESYEADKKAGVKTIFTLLGKEEGKKVVSSLLFLSFLPPILLFQKIFFLFILGGFFSSLLFFKTENYRLVMLIVMGLFIVCALQLKGLF